jgi:hypothetical protein
MIPQTITTHVSESEFNRLRNPARLAYILERFRVGMDICVRVNDRPELFGTIYGFYSRSNTICMSTGNLYDHAKPYNEIPTSPDELKKLPDCNVYVKINGKIEGYYPLWIYRDVVKLRMNKLKEIGI